MARRIGPDDEQDALELARRVAASDVGEETIRRLEWAVDDLATRYSVTPPAELLPRVRRQLGYVGDLLDAPVRKTLSEYRRLLVVGAWLSLLGATLHIDLNQRPAGGRGCGPPSASPGRPTTTRSKRGVMRPGRGTP